jgi:hypothetical protein
MLDRILGSLRKPDQRMRARLLDDVEIERMLAEAEEEEDEDEEEESE